jgi:hypothetical protein
LWDGSEIFDSVMKDVVIDMSNPKFIHICKFVVDFSFEFQQKDCNINSLVQCMRFHPYRNCLFVLLSGGILCSVNMETFHVTLLDCILPDERNSNQSMFFPVSFMFYFQNEMTSNNNGNNGDIVNSKIVSNKGASDTLRMDNGKLNIEIVYFYLYDKDKNYCIYRFKERFIFF